MKFILGKKIEMSQMFDQQGNVIPCTLIEAGPCEVLQIRTQDKDKYEAIQIGFEKKTKNIKKTDKGKEYKHIKEYRIVGQEIAALGSTPPRNDKVEGAQDIKDIKQGDMIDVSVFEQGDKVKVSGMSKGKGFQGGVKRHGFHGRKATHGVKHEQRTIGSVGSAYPQRVIKGRKMPGRMGYDRTTVKNLKIVKIDKENNLIAVKGAVPGRRGTLLEIRG
jgi:large subunit ribosomal protein L3